MNETYTDLEKEIIHRAKKRALQILGVSDRTEKQLRTKLEEGEFPPFAIEEAVAYVYSYHYLDNGRYASNYVHAHLYDKSVFELKNELRNRGVSDELISQAIETEGVDETETVKRLFLKKYAMKDLSDKKIYERALRYYSSKQFPYGAAKEGIRRAIEEMEKEEE